MEQDFRSKMIGIRLSEKEFDALNEVCETLNTTRSIFIRRLINEYLKEAIELC